MSAYESSGASGPNLPRFHVAQSDDEYFYPGWDASPSKGYPPALNSLVPIRHLGGERHLGLVQEHKPGCFSLSPSVCPSVFLSVIQAIQTERFFLLFGPPLFIYPSVCLSVLLSVCHFVLDGLSASVSAYQSVEQQFMHSFMSVFVFTYS